MAGVEGFGPRLRELREQAGLTQEQLSQRAGVQRESVARWERETREPSWGNIIALADALGVSCEAFRKPPATADTAPAPRGRPRKDAQGEAAQPAVEASRTKGKKGKGKAEK